MQAPAPDIRQLSVIGTGLLGGSIGLALRAGGFRGRIVGFGRRRATVELAIETGCVDAAAADLAEAVTGSDMIVLATPVGCIADYLRELSDLALPDAVITDVGSTKASIVAAAEAHLRNPGRFVGAHPMAGSEAHGPESARADLFQHKPVILTPTPGTDPAALDRVEQLWRSLGMRVHRMTPAEHDRVVAHVSHLPHLAAVLLVLLAGGEEALDVASTGFASTTRIASGEPEVWADIFTDNRDAVLAAMSEWEGLFTRFRGLLEQGRRDELLQLLRSARQARDGWVHGQVIESPLK